MRRSSHWQPFAPQVPEQQSALLPHDEPLWVQHFPEALHDALPQQSVAALHATPGPPQQRACWQAIAPAAPAAQQSSWLLQPPPTGLQHVPPVHAMGSGTVPEEGQQSSLVEHP
jgi:hypothetical protein